MRKPEALSDGSIVGVLRTKGYKATPQRIAICRFAASSREHPTAGRIYNEVRKQHPTVSLATVYKTLDILNEHHIIQELAMVDGDKRFDSNTKTHLNLICVRCGEIRDSDNPVIKDFVEKAAEEERFNVTGENLTLYGVCHQCAAKHRGVMKLAKSSQQQLLERQR
jgi:Fur family peroxide stress response transcriptional regulator